MVSRPALPPDAAGAASDGASDGGDAAAASAFAAGASISETAAAWEVGRIAALGNDDECRALAALYCRRHLRAAKTSAAGQKSSPARLSGGHPRP